MHPEMTTCGRRIRWFAAFAYQQVPQAPARRRGFAAPHSLQWFLAPNAQSKQDPAAHPRMVPSAFGPQWHCLLLALQHETTGLQKALLAGFAVAILRRLLLTKLEATATAALRPLAKPLQRE